MLTKICKAWVSSVMVLFVLFILAALIRAAVVVPTRVSIIFVFFLWTAFCLAHLETK